MAAKPKQPKSIYLKAADGSMKQVDFEKALASWKKTHGIKPAEVEGLVNAHLKGLDEPELGEDMPTAEQKKFTAIFKAIRKDFTESNKHIAKLEAYKQRAVADKQKELSAITLASAQGAQVAMVLHNHYVDDFNKVLGKKFVVTSMGCQIAEGATINKADLATAIGIASMQGEAQTNMRTTSMFVIGDLCVAAENAFGPGEADELIEQVVNTTGLAKHTVQEGIRLAKFFPPDKRIEGFSATHHLELKNYSDGIKPATLKKIIEEAANGDVVQIKTADGKVIEQKRPISCAKLRQKLQAASESKNVKGSKDDKAPSTPPAPGKNDLPPGGSGNLAGSDEDEGETPQASSGGAKSGYLYISGHAVDGKQVFKSKNLDTSLLGSCIVIDLESNQVLDSDGNEEYGIEEAPDDLDDQIASAADLRAILGDDEDEEGDDEIPQ